MKSGTLLLITILITGLLPVTAYHANAFPPDKNVTPYGAYCDRVSHYGMHHKPLSDKEVYEALKHYYGEKDLDFEIINSRGKFVKALIKDGNKTVDTIIFDRYTGRIRSVY